MYGIVTCIWLKFMEHVGKYVIHGSYGDGTFFGFILGITATAKICWVKELRVGWMAFQRPGERGSLQRAVVEFGVVFSKPCVFHVFEN